MTEQTIRVLLVEDNPDVATTMQTLLVDASPVGEDQAEGPAAFDPSMSKNTRPGSLCLLHGRCSE